MGVGEGGEVGVGEGGEVGVGEEVEVGVRVGVGGVRQHQKHRILGFQGGSRHR